MSVPYPSIQPLEQQPLVGTSTDASGSRSWGQQPLFFFLSFYQNPLETLEKRRITDPKTLQNSVLAIEQDSVCESLWRQWQKVKGWMTKRAEARRRDLTRLLCVVSAAPTWMFFCVCVLEEEGKRWNKEYRSRLSLWYISLRFFYDKDRSDEGGKNGSAGIESSIIPPMFWNDDDNGQQRKKKETNIFCFAVNERLSQVWMASDSFCESLWISKREKHIFPIYKLRREISPSSSSTLPKISLWKSPEEFIYIYIKGGLVCVLGSSSFFLLGFFQVFIILSLCFSHLSSLTRW